MSIITVSMIVLPFGSGTILTNGQRIDTIQMYSGTPVTWQAIPSAGQKFEYFILPVGVLPTGVITNSNPITTAPGTSGTTMAVFTTASCQEVAANLTTT